MAKWHKVVAEDGFKSTYCFFHRRKQFAIFRLEDGIYATDNSCSHEYSPLCEGMIVEGDVYCPKHGSRFDIRTGAVKDFPATRPVKTYETKVEDGFVWIKA
ncbi:MAG: non-heme iron oxygenase ferredoxin subunit [Spirochaetaceae bacterium]|nr:MAG: non-heme iron oxygenase ferredoxin subunit [Spirochaetaceae bacterium]